MGKRNNKKTPTKQQDEESKRPTVLDEDNGQQDKVVVDNEHSEEDDERVVKGVVALAGHTNKKNNKDHHYEESSSSSSSVEKSSEEENDEESSGSSNSSDDDDDDDDDDANNKNIIQVPSLSPTTVGGNSTAAGDEPCTLFDLRNLLAINAHPLFLPKLYNNNSSSTSTATILSQQQQSSHHVIINEMYLLEKTEQNTNQLITELWGLPMTSSGNNSGGTSQVPMVQLPSYEESPIPRSLPPPPTNKVETKWEKFAKAKGIGQNQDKRSRKVWDETLGEWKYRHGYEKADNNNKEWPIMEANPNDPYEDPWEKQRNAKKANIRKNTEQKMRNQERSGQLAKGTTKRLLAAPVPPAGVPIDLLTKEQQRLLRGPTSTMKALQQTQHSTASLGKFDRMRPDEPERKQNKKTSTRINNDKKRKQQQTNNTNNETERSQKVLRLLEKGGGVDEKASRRRLASTGGGETAYDYDFDDGLLGGKFRKKKGRAGVGKMKKMTKKRVK